MAILPLTFMGNPILTARALEVADPTDPAIAALIADMGETMIAARGVGLAAPQVGMGLRAMIFMVPEGRSADGFALPLTVVINPEIVALGPETDDAYEGCLSIPGLTGLVPRYSHIGYRGLALDGSIIEREAHGFHARVAQHEYDHLEGVLYPMRMADLSTLAFTEELRRQAEQAQAQEQESRDEP